MADLYEFLKNRLKDVKRLAVIGAGSLLMADDAAGVIAVERLKEVFGEEEYPDLKLYIGETSPENFSGEIKRFRPSHLIILDAADLGEEPGSVLAIDPDAISGVSFSTHLLPLKIMTEYLEKEIGCVGIFLGIQHKDATFGGDVTAEIRQAVEEITEIIARVVRETMGHE